MNLVFILAVFVFVAAVVFFYFARTFGIPARIHEAEQQLTQGNSQKAIEILKKILNVDTGNPKARFVLARAYYDAEQYILGINELKKLLLSTEFKKHFRETEIRYLLAEIYNKSGEWAKEINEYKLIQSLNPNDEFVNKKLGLVYFDQKDYEKAYSSLKKLMEAGKEDLESIKPFAVSAYETNHLSEAKDYFEKIIKTDPNDLDSHFYMGMSLKKEELFPKAIEHFSKSSEDPSLREKSFFNIGQINMDRTEYEKAAESFKKIPLSEERINLEAAYNLALCHEKLGNIPEAINAWDELNGVSANYRNVRDKIEQYSSISESSELSWFFALSKDETIKFVDTLTRQLGFHKASSIAIHENLFYHTVFRDKSQLDSPVLIETHKTTKELSEIAIHDFIKNMEEKRAMEGIIITTSEVSPKALKFIEGKNIHIINGQDLTDRIQILKTRINS